MQTQQAKAFILGIDGATFDIINPMMACGKLPSMQKIVQTGVSGTLHSTIPSLSAPAWVSFMTGKNPGHYGTYHFRKIDVDSYENIFCDDLVNSSFFRGETFFDYLGKLGYKVGVMTVPVTYPPWEVNGFLVSGYPCPDPARHANFTFPPEVAASLPKNLNWTEIEGDGKIPKEELRGAREPDDILKGGKRMMRRRTAATFDLMARYHIDVTVLVWGAIDRAQHMLWKYHDPEHVLHEKGNRYRDYIEQLYSHADLLLGRIMNHVGPDTRIFVVSDHGAGKKQGSHFHMNAWLGRNGFLKASTRARILDNRLAGWVKRPLRHMMIKYNAGQWNTMVKRKQNFYLDNLDFRKTSAYRFPIDEQTEGLVINLKGRQPSGAVDNCEYEAVRTCLIKLLSEFRDPLNGNPVVKQCFRREELYSGSKLFQAPDIIVSLEDNYFPGSACNGPVCSPLPPVYLETISGNHRREGIFLACGPEISKGDLQPDASIMDVAPTVLYALGEKIPSDMEGKPLESVFRREGPEMRPVYFDRDFSGDRAVAELSAEEQENMADQLKELGYI